MNEEKKSVLDDVSVKDDAFPLNKSLPPNLQSSPALVVVGACSLCGSPIYGPRVVRLESGEVVTRRTCDCKATGLTLEGTTRTT